MDEYIFYAIWRIDLLKIVASGEEMSHTDTAKSTHTYGCRNEFGANKIARIVSSRRNAEYEFVIVQNLFRFRQSRPHRINAKF